MRKLIFIVLIISLAFSSCTKTKDVIDDEKQISKAIDFFGSNKESIEFYMKEIENAKIFFESQITTSAAQRFKKTPNWKQAYNVKTTSGAEKVFIPLKYEKDYSFKTSFSGNKNFSLEKQSVLSIYKDASAIYQAEVVTTYPDQTYLNGLSKSFEGLVTIDDWNEHRIKTYLFKEGKYYSIQNPDFNPSENANQSSGRTTDICAAVDWYWCEGWETYISQCSYIGTTYYENCADYQSLEPIGDEGGYEWEVYKAKTFQWEVKSGGAGGAYISSYDRVHGKKGPLWQYPAGGYITHVNHQTSPCSCPNNGVWMEDLTKSKFEVVGQRGSAYVEGTLSYQGSNYTYSNSQYWWYSDL